MSRRYMTEPEYAAIIGGLRMLQEALDNGFPNNVGEILSNSGQCEPLDADGIEILIDDMQSCEVQLP